MRGLSLVVASGGHSSSWCTGLSLSRPLLLWSTGSRRAGSVIVAHRPSCSAAREIFPDQGLNPCPLHWQADSQPLRHQGSPPFSTLNIRCHFHLPAKFLQRNQLIAFWGSPCIWLCFSLTAFRIISLTFVILIMILLVWVCLDSSCLGHSVLPMIPECLFPS